jgi:hypothetical protein
MDTWVLGNTPTHQMPMDPYMGPLGDFENRITLNDILPEEPLINNDPNSEQSWYLTWRINRSKEILRSAANQTLTWIEKANNGTAMGKLLRYKKSQVIQFIRRRKESSCERPMTKNMRNNFEEAIMYERVHLTRITQMKDQTEEYCRILMEQIYEFEYVKSECMFESDALACDIHIWLLNDIFQEWTIRSIKITNEIKKTKTLVQRFVHAFNSFAV